MDPKGKSIALPPGDLSTPMRLEGLIPGTYKIIFQGPDNTQQTQSCELSSDQHLCTVSFGEPNIQQLMGGRQ
jgi:serine/threonine-protein kinase